jgi:hypothetical protein
MVQKLKLFLKGFCIEICEGMQNSVNTILRELLKNDFHQFFLAWQAYYNTYGKLKTNTLKVITFSETDSDMYFLWNEPGYSVLKPYICVTFNIGLQIV